MLSSFPVALAVGTVLGFLAGLGVGGGSLLILWLTLILNMSQEAARILNLLFFLPSAVIACVFRWKQKSLPISKIWPAIAAGCAGAFLASSLGASMDTTLLKKLFGGLLVLTGIRELSYKPQKHTDEQQIS